MCQFGMRSAGDLNVLSRLMMQCNMTRHTQPVALASCQIELEMMQAASCQCYSSSAISAWGCHADVQQPEQLMLP